MQILSLGLLCTGPVEMQQSFVVLEDIQVEKCGLLVNKNRRRASQCIHSSRCLPDVCSNVKYSHTAAPATT